MNLFLDILFVVLAPEAHFDCSINGLESARAPAVRSDSRSDKIESENIIDHQIASPKLSIISDLFYDQIASPKLGIINFSTFISPNTSAFHFK